MFDVQCQNLHGVVLPTKRVDIGHNLLDQVDLILPHLLQKRVAIISNTTVAPLYLDKLREGLKRHGIASVPIILPDGESYKNWETMNQIFDNMKYWGLNPDDIKYCILTHPHFDHAAGGHLLKERGVSFIATSETADSVSTGDERTCPYLYHKKFIPFQVDTIVSDEEKFKLLGIEFEVMHLPGHSMGCTAYLFNFEGRRINETLRLGELSQGAYVLKLTTDKGFETKSLVKL